MNTCDNFEDALWEAASSGVIPDILQTHCASCTCCQHTLHSLQRAMVGFSALTVLETPAPRPNSVSSMPTRQYRLQYAFCLAALCFIVSLLCLRHSHVRLNDSSRITAILSPTPQSVITPGKMPAPPVMHTTPQVLPPDNIAQGRHPRKPLHLGNARAENTQHTPAVTNTVPIVGHMSSRPADAMVLDTDRITAFADSQRVSNDIYSAMAAVDDDSSDGDIIIIYRKPVDG